ncbi:MAG: flavodoxin family protein [Proteobacteria bacterium]|nr:flavodoxin family protein [Pseudomonadota bacterium]
MVLGIAGSGRKNGNSSRLLAAALAGAEAAGLGPQRLFALAERSFQGCLGCRCCREGADACVLRDDLTEVLEATARADAVVLATPIYYGYATGLFKSYLDRWYAFRDPERRLRVAPKRPALLLLTQGNPDAAAYSWTRQSLEKVLVAYGLHPSTLVGPSLNDPTALLAAPELLARARSLGAALAKGV